MNRALLACALLALAAGVRAQDDEDAVPCDHDDGAAEPKPPRPPNVRVVSGLARLALQRFTWKGEPWGWRFERWTYALDARYVLSNPDPPVVLPLAIRIEGFDARDVDFSSTQPELWTLARDIRISVAGVEEGCTVEHDRDGRVQCTTEVEIPTGKAVELRIRSRHPLVCDGAEALRCRDEARCTTECGAGGGTLLHALVPGAPWAGKIDRLELELHPGAFAGTVAPVAPAGWRAQPGGVLAWELRGVDPLAPGALRVEATQDLSPSAGEEAIASGSMAGLFAARASSTLPPQGKFRYDAANVLDGERDTAWCARHGTAAGEWIELRAPRDPMPGCRLAGYFVTPGYVRDQKAWERNHRLARVRLGSCGDAAGGTEVRFAPESLSARSAGQVVPPVPDPFGRAEGAAQGEACVRLTILEVVRGPGAAADTCVSKFRPVWDCPATAGR